MGWDSNSDDEHDDVTVNRINRAPSHASYGNRSLPRSHRSMNYDNDSINGDVASVRDYPSMSRRYPIDEEAPPSVPQK
jgi:hypothetical protein